VRPRGWAASGVATVVVTTAVLGPLLVNGGIALRGDMVFTPDQPWKPAWLGLDGSVPRAVPMDAVVSVLDNVVPGALLQRLLLVAAFVAGRLGIGRLTRGLGTLAQVAAVVVYLWNPWVYERLAIGQWPTALGYGLLPWVVIAATAARAGRPVGWSATALTLVLAGVCAPSVGLVGALVAVVVVAVGGSWRRTAAVTGLAVVANLPWILPGMLGTAVHASRSQFDEFAARPESSLGTVASVLSMGGIWKTSVVPPERTHVVVVGVAAMVALACVAGVWYAVPLLGRRTAAAVAAVGVLALALAVLPALAPVARGLGALSTDWPAIGILRDSQRYLAPLGLVLAVGAGALVERLVTRARRGQPAWWSVAFLVVAAPVLLLPSLAWGLAGALRPVNYPSDWDQVAARVADGGGTVTLPWTGSYRGFAWNDHRAVLDPAPRFLPGDVLVDDRLFLRHAVLPGEDPFLARVRDALAAEDPARALGDLGVRWVLVEKGNGVEPSDVPPGNVVFDGSSLSLVDLGKPRGDVDLLRQRPPWSMVTAGDMIAGFVGCVSVVHLLRHQLRTRR